MELIARRSRFQLVILVLLLAVMLAGCGPEGNRSRGVGDGADVNNTGDTVDLHGDKAPEDSIYYQTPRENPAGP